MFALLNSTATKAGAHIAEKYSQTVQVSYKDNKRDLLTEVDIASQEIIQRELVREMKKKGFREDEVGFLGEENLHVQAKHMFIIDPLDGTSGFAQGLDYFCVSLAYSVGGIITDGLIYDPIRKVTYYGKRGGGAYKLVRGKKLPLSIAPRHSNEVVLAFNGSTNPQTTQRVLAVVSRLAPTICKFRSIGSCALSLAYLADNKFQAMINPGCRVWDIAASNLIVHEAGGIITDWEGIPISVRLNEVEKKYQIVASHPSINADMTSITQQVLPL